MRRRVVREGWRRDMSDAPGQQVLQRPESAETLLTLRAECVRANGSFGG